MRRWILITLAGLLLLVGGVWLVGALLPEEHVAATRAVYHQPPDSLFAAITGVAAHPEWRPDIEAVEVLSDRPLRWRETGEYGAITYRAETVAPPFRFAARIDDPSQPFGGRWTWSIRPRDDGGTAVSITEEGEIYNAFFRVFARFVFGYYGAQEAYLQALGERFGEQVAVERIEPAGRAEGTAHTP